MKLLQKFLIIALSLLVPLFIYAQSDDETAKEDVTQMTEMQEESQTAESQDSEMEEQQAIDESSITENTEEVADTQETEEPQELQESAPVVEIKMPNSVYVNSGGTIYVKGKSPIYLRLSTSADEGAQSFLLKQGSNDVAKPFQFEGHGRHTIQHAADHRIPQKNKNDHIFYVQDDSKMPKSKVSVTKAPWVYNGNVNIYGKPVTITLSFKDADSGVFSGFVALNSDAFSMYENELSLNEEIDYELRYYAVDNVGNESKKRLRLYSMDFTPPESTYKILGPSVNIEGEDVLSPRSKIGLKSKDMKAGVKHIRYRFKGKRGVYKKVALNMKGLKDGTHSLIYAAEDRVENAEANRTFSFYLDSVPPVTSDDLVGDQYLKGKTQYVSGRTNVELTSSDNKAGVRRVRYYVGSQKSKTYDSPFAFPMKNGKVTYGYRTSDKVRNVSSLTEKTVVVDISAPKVKPIFKGEHYYSRKTHYVRMNTKISLSAKDNLSGIQNVFYILDQNPEIKDRAPFSIDTEGAHIFKYWAIDNVNNQNDEKMLNLYVDETAPEIFQHFSVNTTNPGEHVYPLKSLLYLAATDKQSGIRNIFYSINDGKFKKYKNPISFKIRKSYNVKMRSVDNVGNISTGVVDFIIQ